MTKFLLEEAITSVGSPPKIQAADSEPKREAEPYPMATAGGSYNNNIEDRVPVLAIPAGPIAPGWESMQCLPLDVERDEDGSYVVSDAMLLVYGIGESQREALEDYIAALIDYYDVVEAGARNGSAADRRELRRVREYLRPVSG